MEEKEDKNCIHCMVIFKPKMVSQKYCSVSCRETHYEKLFIARQEANYERMKNDIRMMFCNRSGNWFYKGMRQQPCDNCTCGFDPKNVFK